MSTLNEQLQHLFPDLEPALRTFLQQNGKVVNLKAGDQIMRTGQPIRSTVLVLEGRLRLYRQDSDGGEFLMYYLEPGKACALSIICAARQQSSEVTAVATDDAVLLTIPIALMDEMMKQFRTWYYFVLENYRERFEELLVVIDQIAFKSMDERLLHYLQNRRSQQAGPEIRLTHSEIASDLNSSREVISRLLKKMEQRGELILHRNYIQWLG